MIDQARCWGTVRSAVLKPFEALFTDAKLPVRVISHHVEMPGACKNGGMGLATGDLLDQDVETTSLRNLEALHILVALLKFLVIEAKLAISVVAPHEDLSKVKCYRLLNIVRSGASSRESGRSVDTLSLSASRLLLLALLLLPYR